MRDATVFRVTVTHPLHPVEGDDTGGYVAADAALGLVWGAASLDAGVMTPRRVAPEIDAQTIAAGAPGDARPPLVRNDAPPSPAIPSNAVQITPLTCA